LISTVGEGVGGDVGMLDVVGDGVGGCGAVVASDGNDDGNVLGNAEGKSEGV
jgi:hypothetical protein